MASVLTEHVRDFPATSGQTHQVLPALEELLRERMRERNLLAIPPRRLGYAAFANWDSLDAIAEIVSDCYIFAVLQRLVPLRNQLKVKLNLDGLVARNVVHFLVERWRRFDLIGYAVYGNITGAILEASEDQSVLLVHAPDGEMCRETVVVFDHTNPDARPASEDRIREVVNSTSGSTQTARYLSETTEEGREWVLGVFERFREAGVGAVRAADLIHLLTTHVRAE